VTSDVPVDEESITSKRDQPTKSKNVTLSGNKSILASYLTTPSSTKSLSLAELLSQPALNTDQEPSVEEQDNKGSSTGSLVIWVPYQRKRRRKKKR